MPYFSAIPTFRKPPLKMPDPPLDSVPYGIFIASVHSRGYKGG